MKLKECGREWLWPTLRYSPGICLDGPKKTTKPSVKMAHVRVDIWTRDPSNANHSTAMFGDKWRQTVAPFSFPENCISENTAATSDVRSQNTAVPDIKLPQTENGCSVRRSLPKKNRTIRRIFHIRISCNILQNILWHIRPWRRFYSNVTVTVE
jgi:hypothetical protein